MFTDYGIFLMDRDKRMGMDEKQESHRFHRKDSFRKVLPSKPSASTDSRLSMSMRMVERPEVADADRRGKAYAPFFLEYALISEFAIFKKNEIQGLYISPADKDPLLWYGVLFLHSGPFNGAIFRFQVHFSPTFPDGPCPRIVFEETIFHPAIDPDTGDLNVNSEFPVWRKTVNQVWQVLQYAKSVFHNFETKNPSNIAASRMLIEDPAEFKLRAQNSVKSSRLKLFLPPEDDDANYIIFDPPIEDNQPDN